jgi:hypothetical protein
MTFLAALVVLQTPFITRPQQFLEYSQGLVGGGVEARVSELFQNKDDSAYLFKMARGRGGLRAVKVAMIPAPPGWEDTAPYWMVFSARQDIQEEHDAVHMVLRTSNGFRIGREIPEWSGIESRIADVKSDVKLVPSESRAHIHSIITFDGAKTTRAPIMRLGLPYRLRSAQIGGAKADVVNADETLPAPKEGDVVKAGGLLVPWTAKPEKTLHFEYDGVVNSPNEDKINDKQVYLTAWWTPSTGRLPHTTSTRIRGPKSWVLKSEGPEVDPNSIGFPSQEPLRPDEQLVAFKNHVPITFPKVIGGAYKVVAELKANGRTYRSYQLEPVDAQRGQKEAAMIKDAVDFFEKTLGPFPYDHYYSFDAVGYYGIESYSHTLLEKGITLRFIPHEIAHTYFGGLVPSAYVRDTWNEGVTQYIDSVVYQNNVDRSLESGLRTISLDLPLTKMTVAHDNGSATYYRGAYVMKMLEDEIGRTSVLVALRSIIRERVGKDTTWLDLLPYFERSSGQKLEWFWNQWIANSKFPMLSVYDAEPIKVEKRWHTRVTVNQSGTGVPYRLRYRVIVRRGPLMAAKVVTTRAPGETFTLESDFEPTSAEVEAFPFTLARVMPTKRR